MFRKTLLVTLVFIAISSGVWGQSNDDLFEQGLRQFNSNEFEDAIESFSTYLSIETSAAAYYNRALAYEELGDYENALADFEKTLEIDAEDHSAMLGRVGALVHLGYYKIALSGIDEYLSKAGEGEGSDLAELYINRGLCNYYLDDLEQAVEDYTQALEVGGKSVIVYFNRGIAYRDLPDLDNAYKDFELAVVTDPSYKDARFERGSVSYDLGKYEIALHDFTEYLKMDSTDAAVYNIRGMTFGMLDKRDEAIADFGEAIKLAPEEPYAYYNRGLEYEPLEEYDKSIADFSKAIELDSTDMDNYYQRGLVYHKLDEYEKSIADLEKVIQEYPNDEDVKQLLSTARFNHFIDKNWLYLLGLGIVLVVGIFIFIRSRRST